MSVSTRLLCFASVTALICGASSLGLSSAAFAIGEDTLSVMDKVDQTQPMLLEAKELRYDFDNDVITANGEVEIYYGQYTLEAKRVVYDRKSGRFSAHGNVRMTEPDGNLVLAQDMELSDDFANGFIKTLEIYSPNYTKLVAESAERPDDNTLILNNGAYSVYTRSKPVWRIKSTKVIHNKSEKTVEFERASFEFLGKSIATVPYFSLPDPTVKRKSGFLIPDIVAESRLGYGLSIPYYWALDPNYDLTTKITPLTSQGVLLQADWRQEFAGGRYTFSVGGINQTRPGDFAGSSGDVRGRFIVNTTGTLRISDDWNAGWNLSYASDRAFREDYKFTRFGLAQEVSEIYALNTSQNMWFDARAIAFQITQEDNPSPIDPANPSAPFTPVDSELQQKQPIVHPVVDHSYIFENGLFGGELAYQANLTSLTRDTTDAISVNGTDRFRGVEGTFTRLSADLSWRRTLIGPFGQVFTPFAYAKTNLFLLGSQDSNVEALTDEAFVFRGMPAVGLEYRYPFIAQFSGGNQIIEPVAQVIVRPNETRVGELPNEDAQSIVFDASTLFRWDKFSGFDRDEGGTRANVGLNYKLQFNQGSFVSGLIGRSFQLAGRNSYSAPDILDATGDSGLQTAGSDYVSSLYFDTNTGFRMGANARFDQSNFDVKRAEINAAGRYGPVSSTLGYAFLARRPDAGIVSNRSEIVGAANLDLQENWRLFGSLRYDLENSNIVQDTIGFGYNDEGLSMSLSYGEDRSRNNGEPVNRIFFFRFGLRTIGDYGLTQSAGAVGSNSK